MKITKIAKVVSIYGTKVKVPRTRKECIETIDNLNLRRFVAGHTACKSLEEYLEHYSYLEPDLWINLISDLIGYTQNG